MYGTGREGKAGGVLGRGEEKDFWAFPQFQICQYKTVDDFALEFVRQCACRRRMKTRSVMVYKRATTDLTSPVCHIQSRDKSSVVRLSEIERLVAPGNRIISAVLLEATGPRLRARLRCLWEGVRKLQRYVCPHAEHRGQEPVNKCWLHSQWTKAATDKKLQETSPAALPLGGLQIQVSTGIFV